MRSQTVRSNANASRTDRIPAGVNLLTLHDLRYR